jgi:hypothetical protein
MTSLVVNHQIFYPYELNETFVSNLIDPIGYFMNKLGLDHHSDHFREEEIDLADQNLGNLISKIKKGSANLLFIFLESFFLI